MDTSNNTLHTGSSVNFDTLLSGHEQKQYLKYLSSTTLQEKKDKGKTKEKSKHIGNYSMTLEYFR